MEFPRTPLYVICDADACARAKWGLTDYAAACLAGGARLLQIRAKEMSGREWFDAVQAIVELAHPADALVVVNDRADIARMTAAGGVHVGQDDLTPAQVRAVAGEDVLVGLSTHTLEQIDAATGESIDYLAIGPIYGTASKATGYNPVGLERVREAHARASSRRLPVVAIGGMTLDRAPAVLDAGAQAVAIIGDLLATGDPEARVREYLAALA